MGLFENQSYFINQKELLDKLGTSVALAIEDDDIGYVDEVAEPIEDEEMPQESDYTVQDTSILRADPFDHSEQTDSLKTEEESPFISKLPNTGEFFKFFPIVVTFLTGSEIMQATNLFLYTLLSKPDEYLVYIFYGLVLIMSFGLVKYAWRPSYLLFQTFSWLKCACMFLACIMLNNQSVHFSSVSYCRGGMFQGNKLVKCNDFVNVFSFICVICLTEVIIVVCLFVIWLLNLSSLKQGMLRQDALNKYIKSLDMNSKGDHCQKELLLTSDV